MFRHSVLIDDHDIWCDEKRGGFVSLQRLKIKRLAMCEDPRLYVCMLAHYHKNLTKKKA